MHYVDASGNKITTSYLSRSCPLNSSILTSTSRSCNISSSSLRYGLCSLGVATADFSVTTVTCNYITMVIIMTVASSAHSGSYMHDTSSALLIHYSMQTTTMLQTKNSISRYWALSLVLTLCGLVLRSTHMTRPRV